MKRFRPFAYIVVLWLIALVVPPTATGKVEHHAITSQILADSGQLAERELSVYLPGEYDTSRFSYPVLYLLHGGGGATKNIWFDFGIVRKGNLIAQADKRIELGEAKPLIIVMPDMGGGGRPSKPYEDYLIREILPFVEEKYRTVARRDGRAIAGHSRGGADAFHIALQRPDLFTLTAGWASGGERAHPTRAQLAAHDQRSFPLEFWVYCGRNDNFGLIFPNRAFVEILKELGLPHAYVEDDGDHGHTMIDWTFEEGIMFLSERLGGGVVAVQPQGKLTTTWGKIKRF